MKLILKQKIFSLLDSYDIYNEQDEIEYQVKSVFDFSHHFVVYHQGLEVGELKQKVLTLLPAFMIYENGQELCEVKSKLTFWRDRLEIPSLNWMVQGDLFHWDYNIYEAERLVTRISKEWFHFSDVYVIDIQESKDALRVLMVALAIDALHCHD